MENYVILLGGQIDGLMTEIAFSPVHSGHIISSPAGYLWATVGWFPVGTSIRDIVPSRDGTRTIVHVNVSSKNDGVVVLAATTTEKAVNCYGTTHVVLASIANLGR